MKIQILFLEGKLKLTVFLMIFGMITSGAQGVSTNLTLPAASHDLDVINIICEGSFEAGDPLWVNGTVLNLGTENETNIDVEYYVNFMLDNSTIISSLNSSEQKVVSFLWTPPLAGLYQLSIFVIPVPGEAIIGNNWRDKIINITAEPDIWINPSGFDFAVVVGNTDSDIMTIGNNGLGNLNFTIDRGVSNDVIEDFENAGTWSWAPWIDIGSGGIKSSVAAHDGIYGLTDTGSTNHWRYRTDVTIGNVGDKLTTWVRSPTSGGRVYLGFGATSSGCWSLVFAPNTNQLMFQQNAGYLGFTNLNSASQTYTANWYKIEVEWISSTDLIGRLYDSSGTTLVNSITQNIGGLNSAGTAIRSFAGCQIDTIEYLSAFGGGSADWLTVTPDNGTVLPFDSTDISLVVDTSTLTPGFYSTNFSVHNNDLGNPELNVSVNLTVLSQPHDIAVQSIIVNGDEAGKPVWINGSILNMGTSNESNVQVRLLVNMGMVNSTILPSILSGQLIPVSFVWTPPTAGQYTLSLYAVPVPGETITSNNQLDSIVNITAQPDIFINPGGFDFIVQIGDNDYDNLTIGNSGLADLDWEIKFPQTGGMDPVNVLILRSPVPTPISWASDLYWDELILNWASYGSRQLNITRSNQNPVTLAYLNSTGADIIVFTHSESLTAGEEAEVAQYISNGHGIYMTRACFIGGFDRITITNGVGHQDMNHAMTVLDPTHPIFDGVPTNYIIGYTFGYIGWSVDTPLPGENNVMLALSTGQTPGGNNYANSEAIFLNTGGSLGNGIAYYSPNGEHGGFGNFPEWQIGYNALCYMTNYTSSTSSVDWLTVNPIIGTTIPSGSSQSLFTVNTSSLSPGFYSVNLTVDSNDPSTPSIIVPVNLTVTSAPHDIAIQSIHVNGNEAGKPVWINGSILNQGTSNEINVQVRLLVNMGMVNSTIIPSILSGQQIPVSFSWTPPTAGQYTLSLYAVPVAGETLTSNNRLDSIVNITAQPDIWVSPGGFDFVLQTGQTDSDILTIGNNGLGTLFFNVTDDVVVNTTLVDDDFEDGDISDWIISAGTGTVGVGTHTSNSGIWSMYTRSNLISVSTQTLDTSGYSSLMVEYWIREGGGGCGPPSENPDMNEDLIVEYYNNLGSWTQLDIFLGTTYLGGHIFGTQSHSLPPNAFHAGFMLRFRQTGGSGSSFDWWHIDDVLIYGSGGIGVDWLSESPVTGVLSASSQTPIIVTVDSTSLTPGFYQGNITVENNDPSTPSIIVPVNLTVTTAPHDIAVQSINVDGNEAGKPVWINGTILNMGTSNEINVQVRLLVNMGMVNSTIIPSILSGQQIPVSFSWTPPAAGQYTLSLYAVPVAGETLTSNNRLDSIVNITAQPDIWVSPGGFDFVLQTGQTDSDILTIGNNGLGTLFFNVTDDVVVNTILVDDDFEDGDISDWTISAGTGTVGVGTHTSNSGIWSMYTRSNPISVSTQTLDTSGYSSLMVEYWIREGGGGCGPPSENPDMNENLIVEYYNNLGSWIQLDIFLGSTYAGGHIFGTQSHSLPPNAFHAGFMLRFRQTDGSAGSTDWWHIDDVLIYGSGGIGVDWLSESPNTGVLSTSSQTPIIVTVDATSLTPGFYQGNILIDNNDPDENSIIVPVNLTVTTAPHDIAVQSIIVNGNEAGKPVWINGSILNMGTSNENNVQVRLLVDMGNVDSIIIPSILSGQQIPVSFSWTPPTAGQYTLSLYSVPVAGEIITSNNQLDSIINIVPELKPLMDINLDVSQPMAVEGDSLIYWINYTDIGNAEAYEVKITEMYPMGLEFISASPAPDMGDNVWHIGTVNPGASGMIIISMKVLNSTIGNILNSVTLEYDDAHGIAQATLYADVNILILDSEPPFSSLLNLSSYWFTNTGQVINAIAGDNESQVVSVELWFRFSQDNSSWSQWTLFGKDSEGPMWFWTFTFPKGDGYYEFFSIAHDSANCIEVPSMVADISCAYDSTSPVIINNSSGIPTTGEPYTIQMTINENINLLEARVVHWFGSGVRTSIILTPIVQSEYALTLTIPSSSLEPLNYIISAVDKAGNNDYTPVHTLQVIDNDAPLAIFNLPNTIFIEETLDLTGSDCTDNICIINYTWLIDDGNNCIILNNESVAYEFLDPGYYLVTLTVSDAAGNSMSHTRSIAAQKNEDSDGDGVPDKIDDDDDNDGFLDIWEEHLGYNPKDDDNVPLDTDGDGIPDGDATNSEPWMDMDDDGDGVLDDDDPRPLDPTVGRDDLFKDYWWILIVLLLSVIIILLLIKRKDEAETEEPIEEELVTTTCPTCGFDIEVGSSCPFCAIEPMEPDIPEPVQMQPEPVERVPQPRSKPMDNQELKERLEKAYQEGKMNEDLYLRNIEELQK